MSIETNWISRIAALDRATQLMSEQQDALTAAWDQRDGLLLAAESLIDGTRPCVLRVKATAEQWKALRAAIDEARSYDKCSRQGDTHV